MDKRTFYFWLLFIASIAISAVIISVFVKALKMILTVILILALAPVIFYILKRLLMPDRKEESDKLKKRE
ncbi:hypothetical protein GCM10027443_34490 [Pontibacter brevis]